MGFSVGGGVGPLRFSTSLGGRGGAQDDGSTLVMAVLLGVCVLLGAGPWAAISSLDGHWGVAAMVAGAAYLVASPVLMLSEVPAWFVGTSWGLYGFWLLGYWDQVGSLFGWYVEHLPKDSTSSLDAFVVGWLWILLLVITGLVVVAVPLGTSWLTARTAYRVLSRALGNSRQSVAGRLQRKRANTTT